jgi:putative SOS response-associated peptidase YedK
MCGRYRRTTQEEELARLYHIPIPKQTDLPISYNIAPSQKVLTIRFNPETRARSLDALEWGLIPYWAKDPKISYRTINARAETIDKAHFFARYLTYRCPLQPERSQGLSPHRPTLFLFCYALQSVFSLCLSASQPI